MVLVHFDDIDMPELELLAPVTIALVVALEALEAAPLEFAAREEALLDDEAGLVEAPGVLKEAPLDDDAAAAEEVDTGFVLDLVEAAEVPEEATLFDDAAAADEVETGFVLGFGEDEYV